MHALAVGYSPAYLTENADGIRRDWPRIPLPDTARPWKLGRTGAASGGAAGYRSRRARRDGREDRAALPNRRRAGQGGRRRAEPDAGDLAVTAGWGHAGKDGVTMPAKGRIVQRAYDKAERDAIAEGRRSRGLSPTKPLPCLGPTPATCI